MAFRSVGINLFGGHLTGRQALEEDLRNLGEANPDFVEVCPHGLGVILGGRLDRGRARVVDEILGKMGFAHTVHAPHTLNLMDLETLNLRRRPSE
jgi:hypothetical protein